VEICKIQEIIAKTEEQELKVIGSDDQGFIDEVDEMQQAKNILYGIFIYPRMASIQKPVYDSRI
jgi:hypothetical protein